MFWLLLSGQWCVLDGEYGWRVCKRKAFTVFEFVAGMTAASLKCKLLLRHVERYYCNWWDKTENQLHQLQPGQLIHLFAFAYQLDIQLDLHSVGQYLLIGLIWLLFILDFEWGGSFLMHHPVKEILIGWHIENGYMWPYVLIIYFLSPTITGLIFIR